MKCLHTHFVFLENILDSVYINKGIEVKTTYIIIYKMHTIPKLFFLISTGKGILLTTFVFFSERSTDTEFGDGGQDVIFLKKSLRGNLYFCVKLSNKQYYLNNKIHAL